jgi:hypothetical protein
MSLDEAVEELIKIADARLSESESVAQMEAVFASYIASQNQSSADNARAQLVRAFVSRGVRAAFNTSGEGISSARPGEGNQSSPSFVEEQVLQEYARLNEP